jgi:hypothetical protein
MTFKWSSLRHGLRLLMVAPLVAGAQSPEQGSAVQQFPTGVFLFNGAWARASDATTPVPEAGQISNDVYTNPYFRLKLPLVRDWIEKYAGPPPSDTGYYVLAQLEPRDTSNGTIRGSMIITAADLFFSPTKAADALQFVNFTRTHLQPDYEVTRAPTRINLAGHSFVRFDYLAPIAGLHWYVLATQIRCHIVQFVFTSRDVKLLTELLDNTARVTLSGGASPVCIKDYAVAANIVERVDPILTGRKFNPIPVRVIIDKEGKIKHTHILSAFPEQSKAILDALQQWKFRPYLVNGQPVEVETGIMFGHSPQNTPAPAGATPAAAMVR